MPTKFINVHLPPPVVAVADVLGKKGIEIAGGARDGKGSRSSRSSFANPAGRHPRPADAGYVRHRRSRGTWRGRCRRRPSSWIRRSRNRVLRTEALDAGARGFVLKEAPRCAKVVPRRRARRSGAHVRRPRPRGCPLELSRDREDEEPDPARARRASPAGRRETSKRGDRQGAVHPARDGAGRMCGRRWSSWKRTP